MKNTIHHIQENLSGYYDPSEIKSFSFLIFNFLFGYSKKDIILNINQIIQESDFHKIVTIVSRLKNKEPIQYILGETEFYGLKFKVVPGVLIPRFETEELIDLIVKRKQNLTLKILDIGTGSGCIAISLKNNLPNSDVWGCDISNTALRITSENAKLNHVELKIVKFDILGNNQFLENDFDLIVSNPPYVTENEKSAMQKNVLDFEPSIALFVPDDDPLQFYRSILLQSKRILKPIGELYFEINEAYGDQVSELIVANGFSAEIHKDINGKDRIAIAKPTF